MRLSSARADRWQTEQTASHRGRILLTMNPVFSSDMHPDEFANWLRLAESMEASGAIDSWFYRRARAIADGKPDPMPSISELMPGSESES